MTTNHALIIFSSHYGSQLKMVSPAVAKALEKAAQRAKRVAEADAGLGEADPPPKFPSKKKSQDLESAKEASRPDTSLQTQQPTSHSYSLNGIFGSSIDILTISPVVSPFLPQ